MPRKPKPLPARAAWFPMTRKGRRLWALGLGLMGVGGAAALALTALEDNVVFFYSPSDLQAIATAPDRSIRIGGLVEQDSVVHQERNATTQFVVTDGAETLTVEFVGALPALFREGQGVVAQGMLQEDGVFHASEVLAKHDENYMPPEVADALERAGKLHHDQDGDYEGTAYGETGG